MRRLKPFFFKVIQIILKICISVDALEGAFDCETGAGVFVIKHPLEVGECPPAPGIPKRPGCKEASPGVVMIKVHDQPDFPSFRHIISSNNCPIS